MTTVERWSPSRATHMLILINILVFAALNLFPAARANILLDPQQVWRAPWTIVTVAFSHEIALHLVLNLALIFVFGRELERLVGAGYVFLAYLLTGVLGSLAILPYAAAIQWTGTAVGASAAAFGIVATLAAIRPDLRILKGTAQQWLLALFVVNLVITVLNPEISIGGPAHAAGIIVGYLLGAWLKRNVRYRLAADA
jgi:membrane associated rhomboid family serine protease